MKPWIRGAGIGFIIGIIIGLILAMYGYFISFQAFLSFMGFRYILIALFAVIGIVIWSKRRKNV